jgi:hypothetical protein
MANCYLDGARPALIASGATGQPQVYGAELLS